MLTATQREVKGVVQEHADVQLQREARTRGRGADGNQRRSSGEKRKQSNERKEIGWKGGIP